MNEEISIEWLNSLPTVGNLKPSSFYIIKPSAGQKPGFFVTSNDAQSVYQVNPDTQTTDFLTSVNGIAGTNGNVNIDVIFDNASGNLTITGGSTAINFDARYLKLSDYLPWQSQTDIRLTSLESAVADGLKTPMPFDATQHSTFPTEEKGTTYKVTVAGTVAGVVLEVGDTIIYDADGNTPYVVQTNVDSASMTVRGLIRIGTQAEVDAGTNNDIAVTPLSLKNRLNNFINEIWATQAEADAGAVNNKGITPATLKPLLDPLRQNSHTHTNKPVLDKFGENAGGNPTYNGKPIYTLGNAEW